MYLLCFLIRKLHFVEKMKTSDWKFSVVTLTNDILINNHDGAIYIYWFQVQNLIERCLQLYMTQKEVVRTLLDQAKIEPGFTELGKKSYSSPIGAFYAETNKSVAR